MKKLLLLAFVVIAPVSLSFAQQYDVVDLKSGRTYRGQILRSDSLSVTMRTASVGRKRELTWPRSDVEKIKSRRILDKMNYILEAGAVIRERLSFEVSFAPLYRVLPRFLVGGGVAMQCAMMPGSKAHYKSYNGISTISIYGQEGLYSFPVYAETRYFLTRPSMFFPYVDLKAGYRFCKKDDGFYLSPTVGVLIAGKFSVGVGVGFCERISYKVVTSCGETMEGGPMCSEKTQIDPDASRHNIWIRAGVRF